jgi:hypothetical protein
VEDLTEEVIAVVVEVPVIARRDVAAAFGAGSEEAVEVNAVTVETVASEVDEETSTGVVLGRDRLPQHLYRSLEMLESHDSGMMRRSAFTIARYPSE